MANADELRAALAVAELEDKLNEAKTAADAEAADRHAAVVARMVASSDPDELVALADELRNAQIASIDPDLKAELREARRVYREMREAYAGDVGDDGEASPSTPAADVNGEN